LASTDDGDCARLADALGLLALGAMAPVDAAVELHPAPIFSYAIVSSKGFRKEIAGSGKAPEAPMIFVAKFAKSSRNNTPGFWVVNVSVKMDWYVVYSREYVCTFLLGNLSATQ